MMLHDNHEHDLKSLPYWTQTLIQQLTSQVQQLTNQVQQLTLRVHELEAQLAKDSSNSGKPPSSDGLAKPNRTKSLRGKSNRKPGGQLGREGKTLNAVKNPDKIVVHAPIKCAGCQAALADVQPAGVHNISLSPGTCANMDKKLFKNLEAFEEGLKAHLIACKVLHLDETGVRCEKKLHWILQKSALTSRLHLFECC